MSQTLETEQKQAVPEQTNTVELTNGSVEYSLVGKHNPEHNPIVWMSGLANSRVNPREAAEILATEYGRQVLILEQPVYGDSVSRSDKKNPEKAIEFQAEAYLAAAIDAGVIGSDLSVDVIAHSLGAQILERVKVLAKQRGIASFEQEKGAHIALAAPAGSRTNENTLRLAGRWTTGFLPKTVLEGKVLDPTKAQAKAIQNNIKADRSKAIGEVRAVLGSKIDYDEIGPALVVIYPEDKMFPENENAGKSRRPGFVNESMAQDLELGFVTPVEPGEVSVMGLKRWLTKFWLKGAKARFEFALNHSGAGHNDTTDNPKRTMATIVDYFDGDQALLERIKAADKQYLSKAA